MRLERKTRRRSVGPACLAAVMVLVAMGVICPEIANIYAWECEEWDGDPSQGSVRCLSWVRSDTPAQSSPSDGLVSWSVSNYKDGKGEAGDDVNFKIGAKQNPTGEPVVDDEEIDFSVITKPADGETSDGGGSTDVDFTVSKLNDGHGSADAQVDFEVNEFLELTVEKNGAAGDPETGKDFKNEMVVADAFTTATATAQSEFLVRGNNRNGFGVYVYAPVSNDLNGVADTATAGKKIEAMGAGDAKTLAQMTENTWGYNVSTFTTETAPDASGLTFSQMPIKSALQTAQAGSSLTPVIKSEKASDGVKFALTTGVKVNTITTAGDYSTEIVVSAVAPFDAALFE